MPGASSLGPFSCVNRFNEDFESFPFDEAITVAEGNSTTLRQRSGNDAVKSRGRYFYLDEPLRHIRRVMEEQEEYRVKHETPSTGQSKLFADRIRMTVYTVTAAAVTSALMYFVYSDNVNWFQ